jgi:hypothetical protein
MKDHRNLLIDLQTALTHCGLDWEMILEDYYDYQANHIEEDLEKKRTFVNTYNRIARANPLR